MLSSRLQEALRRLLPAALVVGLGLLGALPGGCVEEEPAAIFKDVTAAEAYELIQANADNPAFVILDVRPAGDFAQGHIENAINIDYESESFKDQLKALDRGAAYLVYCRSGASSSQTLSLMAVYRFREAYNLIGGIQAWQDAGLPLVD
jgi:rhodanese-related sulfurtransferase